MPHSRKPLLVAAIFLALCAFDLSAADRVWETPPMPTEQWEQVGVASGIPTRLPVIAKLQPGDDLQAAIEAAPASGGVLLLASGDYPLTTTLLLRSNLVLRGVDRVRTRLVLQMRAVRPALPVVENTEVWSTGVRLRGIERCGLEELTVIFDPSLPPPKSPRKEKDVYKDDPDGRSDLHVVSVCFDQVTDCWLTGCLLLNAGTHPLVIANSRHVTVDDALFEGAYNRGDGSGELILAHSEHVLLKNVQAREINTFVIQGGNAQGDCRYNVIADSRFEMDGRLHGHGTANNLIQNCSFALPKWMDRTPLSPGNVNARESPPGPVNLVYLCTITRDFDPGLYAFSMADNPSMIYEVIQTRARYRESSVVIFGPAPATSSLAKIP
ncbi:MAG: hypothetical protein K9M98_03620 [Cephaloticoccus sp.]|nr:hypothetical protein [Cephaloticoccus sp.]MCF7759570.1 hypothetical protein [Cephaloticoccus sp.]